MLVVKGGRSPAGVRAGRSHTAAAYTSEDAIDALFAQAGVLRMDGIESLVDAARLLALQPVPPAAGSAWWATAVAPACWLRMRRPRLASTYPLSAGLRSCVGSAADENPVDLGAGATPDALREAASAIACSGEVDSLLALTATRTNDIAALLDAIEKADLSSVSVLVNVLGADTAPHELAEKRRPRPHLSLR